jgi:DNA-directed RNA polymerase subunit RPC12/RpoP
MARATCRCGQPLEMPREGADHVVCPNCESRVRIIRKPRPPESLSATRPDPGENDGYIRFSCPCGRRLKVSALDRPTHGKCPDCGSIVPVPAQGMGSPGGTSETPTEEMAAADLATLDAWAKGHAGGGKNGPPSTAEMPQNSPARRAEAGLRVCPRCGKPIHLGAESCRACGIPVPKR